MESPFNSDQQPDSPGQDLFRALEESLPHMVWASRPNGHPTYFSPKWQAFTGATADELVEHGYAELVHPDDRERLRLTADGRSVPHVFEFRLRRYDGVYRWMEAHAEPVFARDGTLTTWVGGATDITERRAIEDKARDVQEQLEVALNLMDLGRYAIYLREERVDCNARYSEIIGRDAQEIMDEAGMDGLFAVVHADDVERVKGVLERAMDEGDRYDVEYRIWQETTDGPALRRVVARGRVEKDADGPHRIVGVLSDITEARAEDEARVLLQKREAIGTLVGGLAHDFNNVIAAILSNASVAQSELAAGESPSVSLQEITHGAQHAAELVRRMLDFSREDVPSRAPVDLGAIATQAAALIAPTLPDTTTLHVTVGPALPPLSGDSTQLHQVVMNLISNAASAIGHEPGTIGVDVSAVALTARTARPLAPGAFLRLQVRDDGPGIDDDVLPRIFDPFFTTKSPGEGTGLGLATAQTIARSHGGAITVDTIPGDGTTFTVLLPLDPVEEKPGPSGGVRITPEESGVTPAWPQGTARVMFVDDEPALTMLVERGLPARGCEVVAFNDPQQALYHFAENPEAFDVVISDQAMPKLTGLELIEHLRVLRPDLPVVLTSGFLTPATEDRAADLGVDVIVPKPCSIEELVSSVFAVVKST